VYQRTYVERASAHYADMGNVVIKDRRRSNPLKAGALQDAILESAGFSTIATDVKGLVQIFSAGARRMLGYEEADVVNRLTPADFSDPLQASTVATGFEALVCKAASGGEDQYELTFIRKDGCRLPCIVCVSALHEPGGDIVGYLFMATDNTAQQGFRRMVESVTDCAIVHLDAQGQVLSWNAGAQILDGYSRHEMVGKPGAPELELAAAAATGRHETEGWRSRKDGSRYCAKIVLTSIYDAGGVVRGFARLARDVTGDKSEPQADPVTAVAVPKPVLERSACLLYVEDDEASYALVEQLVASRADVRLLRAANLSLALERARAAHPDVILLNNELPGIGALQFMKLMRADPATQNTPILALSANGAPDAIAKGLQAGFFHYLARPLKGALFMEALAHALEFAARERAEENDRAFTSSHSH
jgi:PAS domain S-box-containing protein